MRRSLLVGIAALLALSGAPAATAKAKPPTASRFLYVIGPAGTAIDVTIPKGATLLAPKPILGLAPGFAILIGGNAWSAVALISRGTRVAGKPVNAVQVSTAPPDHCPHTASPVGAVPRCEKLVEHTSFHGLAAKESKAAVSYALPAGTYQVVLAGPPGAFVGAALTFPSLRAARRPTVLFAGKRAEATFGRVRASDLVAAHATGSFTTKLAGPGIAVLGAWHTTAGDEPGEFSYAQCVAPSAPLTEACAAIGATGQSPPADVAPKFSAIGTPPVTQANSGQVTFQTPLLPAGSYVNSVRVTRAGRGPAAGAFVLWLRTDATK